MRCGRRWDTRKRCWRTCRSRLPIRPRWFATRITLAVQVNGKLRGTIEVPVNVAKEEAERLALAEPGVAQFVAGQAVKKVIVVPGKIVKSSSAGHRELTTLLAPREV